MLPPERCQSTRWRAGAAARQHNLKNVDVDLPRDSIVVFTGVSGSGKSSLAFGTLFAESQRRYLESVAPYARRLIDQAGVPDVDSIDGLPPAVALQQQRNAGNARSSVGSVTTLSSLVRMLIRQAGCYPPGQPMLYAEDFSPNTVQGACSVCHGIGRVYEAAEEQMVPDRSLTIRQRAIASSAARPGKDRICATSWFRWATTSTGRGRNYPRRTGTGFCSPRNGRPYRCTRACRRRRPARPWPRTGSRVIRARSSARGGTCWTRSPPRRVRP